MALRRTRRKWRGRSTRATDWSFLSSSSVINAGPALSLHYALLDEVDLDERYNGDCTVLRCVGDVVFHSATATAAPTIGLCSTGIIVSDVDNVGGITPYGMLTATNDAEAAWLYYRMQTFGTVMGPGLTDHLNETNAACLPNGVHIDVQVMRKLHDRQALLLVLQVDALGGYASLTAGRVTFAIRTLVKTTGS